MVAQPGSQGAYGRAHGSHVAVLVQRPILVSASVRSQHRPALRDNAARGAVLDGGRAYLAAAKGARRSGSCGRGHSPGRYSSSWPTRYG